MRRCVQHLLLSVLISATSDGSTITVRKDGTGDYAVIQQALDVAAAGDTILIGPGEYLEHSTVRFPAWSWDIESYANVTVDNLTIIGAGSGQTIIGPSIYSGNNSTQSPKVITYIGGNDIRISELCVRNAHSGVFMQGRLYMDRCVLSNNYINASWEAVGSGGGLRDCQLDVQSPNWPISIIIMNGGGAGNIMVEDCSMDHVMSPTATGVLVVGVSGVTLRNCNVADGVTGMQIQTNSHVYIDNCRFIGMSSGGLELTLGTGTLCEISDSEVFGGQAALRADATGSRFIVNNSRIEGGAFALMFADFNAGAFEVNGCDLVQGGGPIFRCAAGGAALSHDLRDNYWGSTDEATIQSWIIDHSDNPQIGATVLYSPFAGRSVPTESTSWGDLKALFR